MKTITIQGTEEQFKNLTQLQSSFDEGRLPIVAEIRVYVVDTDNYEFDTSPKTWDNEKFMTEAEIQGTVHTLPTFQEAFNYGDVNTFTDVVRFISVPLF